MPLSQSPSRGEEDNRQGAAGDEEIVPGLPPPTPIRGIVPGDCLMDSAEPTREISRVSVKVPPFWKTNPALWFKQVESQFITAGITSDSTKFHTIVGSIEANVLSEVSDLILQPPSINMYATLKQRIQDRFCDSEEKLLKKLLRDVEIGDKKPSALLRDMVALASGKVSDDLLKSLWMQRLPKQTQAILSVSSESLTQLALMADKIADTSESWELNSISPSSTTYQNALEIKIDALTKQIETLTNDRGRNHLRQRGGRSKSRTTSANKKNKPLCWYHYKFGEKATKCLQPCVFSSNQNSSSENH